jgi:hypothetical protein
MDQHDENGIWPDEFPNVGTTARMPLRSLWVEFEAFGPIGAVNGVLTRFIVLGSRWSNNPG